MVAGGLSGGIGSAIANPCDVLKIRMQADNATPAKTFGEHAKQIFRTEGGIPGFWKGVSTTVTRAVVIGATKLATYDQAKIFFKQQFGLNGLPLQAAGATCAGFALCVTSAPVDFVRTRFMAAKQAAAQTGVPTQYKTPLDVITQTLKKQGPRAFYNGFCAQWGRSAPYSLLQFVIWERISSLMGVSAT